MTPESIDKITQYLDKLASKLGIGVQEVWPWFVRQQYVEAITSIIFFSIFSILAVIFLKRSLKIHFSDGATPTPKDILGIVFCVATPTPKDILGIVFCVATTIFIIVAVVCMVEVLTEVPDIFNVEYNALNDLIGKAKTW